MTYRVAAGRNFFFGVGFLPAFEVKISEIVSLITLLTSFASKEDNRQLANSMP